MMEWTDLSQPASYTNESVACSVSSFVAVIDWMESRQNDLEGLRVNSLHELKQRSETTYALTMRQVFLQASPNFLLPLQARNQQR